MNKQRVGAVLDAKSDGSVMRLLGYGDYVGDEVPPDEIGFGIPNPKIVLDDGKVVWGCECWWGGEEKIKAMATKYTTVEMVDIEKARKGEL